MEDTLGAIRESLSRDGYSLNPCFNGRYSRSLILFILLIILYKLVLILVLMEDTLGEFFSYRLHLQRRS